METAVSTLNSRPTAQPTRKVLAATVGSAIALILSRLLFKYVFPGLEADVELAGAVNSLVSALTLGVVGAAGAFVAGYYTPPHPDEGTLPSLSLLAFLGALLLAGCAAPGAPTAPTTLDPPVVVANSCGAIGELESYAASRKREGKLTPLQVSQIDQLVDAVDPLCTDPEATAASGVSVEQLRLALPKLATMIGG